MRRMRRESIDDLFDQMQKLFNDFQEAGKEVTGLGRMPVDIQREDDTITVKADLPGVSKEDINLKADDESLEIKAESSREVREENEKYVRQERARRSYSRTVSWPAKVDPETIEAEYSDGVLTVTAEMEESEGRDIDIK